MQRLLIFLGLLLLIIGLLWPWLGKLPWGPAAGRYFHRAQRLRLSSPTDDLDADFADLVGDTVVVAQVSAVA